MVEGYPSAGFEKHMGCTFMEMEWTISMAQLIAASGMTAVTHSNREAEPDALALMKHLGAKHRKWVCGRRQDTVRWRGWRARDVR